MREDIVENPLTIVLIDDCDGSRTSLGAGLVASCHTVWAYADFAVESIAALSDSVELIVSEQKIGCRSIFQMYDALRRVAPRAAFAIVTAYPSVASAVRAVRMGCEAYIAKPVTADGLLEVLAREAATSDKLNGGDAAWPSLDRTIWEYLNQVYESAGSMSEAARRLRLDRRSLRRMLSKYPPSR